MLRIFTDRGIEYCGKIEEHVYQLFIAAENIDHSKTKARSPQTNGICERFHRTMKQEFYDIAFRKKIYQTLDELHNDVNLWLKEYNELRPHSGHFCYSKTPMQTLNQSKAIAIEKQLDENFFVAENATELTESEKVSLDTFLQSGSNAPSEKSIKEISDQDAYCKELETRSHLSGSETV